MSRQVRMIRSAISPRLQLRTFLNTGQAPKKASISNFRLYPQMTQMTQIKRTVFRSFLRKSATSADRVVRRPNPKSRSRSTARDIDQHQLLLVGHRVAIVDQDL